ncbi:MAG TPA: M35 family metallo-endopeptidase [Thermoanaerobaculia bacterium]|nr:M35 family metallo-endopeptidase [Thermoanaerobaculia bacterium]
MKLNGVRKWVLAAVAALLVGSQAASAGVLTATLEPEKSSLGATDDAVFRFTLYNETDKDLRVLSWYTPLRGVEENIFDVTRDGEPVPYIGRLYKWAQPTPADFIRIPAGGSVSAAVELSSVYDMSAAGEYSFQYRVHTADAVRGAKAADITSNVVVLTVDRALVDPMPATELGDLFGEDKYRTPGYVSCSSSRQSTLLSAISNAESISLKARNYLNNLSSTLRPTDIAYRTWFGSYTSSRYSTVQSHYNNIYGAFNGQTVTFHCDCTSSAYAYVYSNQPYRIHLCNAFWNAPMTGIDSKAGTLVHEMSHFSVVAGTQDYAYGTSAAQSLANSNPSRAISNADNHEYFAETR